MLRSALKRLDPETKPAVVPLDINRLLRAILTNPGAFGFANATFPCIVQDDTRIRVLTGACPVDTSAAPLKLITTGTVFYDLLHPTEAVHDLIAAAAQGAVAAAATASGAATP
jgi:phospholipase/lecithinase/hemolysin